ncbi:nascent polypeptide-associated complex subunit alpha, muscle-specific form-like [Galendromus occidentalis]|uniref:Nascent polypeptide-associated complex subunit alpha, muscle-specific form-like n=1 Tax=Galendromus occidentalis TaxID=34638 RepID=A0AAJ7P9H2_9ACAR|nr:nascent polypeptide-associated complex subunit alpha, muscle-specific form-like [Galendromus occidentalis]
MKQPTDVDPLPALGREEKSTRSGDAQVAALEEMVNKKSRMRIQLATNAKISLKKKAPPPAEKKADRPKDEPGMSTPTEEISVGMILRSCLASMDAMLGEVQDHRVDTETETPDFKLKFKGCLAAVGATIAAEPGTDFRVSNDISPEKKKDTEEETSNAVESEETDSADVVRKEPGRPKKAVRNLKQTVDPGDASESPAEQNVPTKIAAEKQVEKSVPTRALRNRSAKAEPADDQTMPVTEVKLEDQKLEATDAIKRRGRSGRTPRVSESTAASGGTQDRDKTDQNVASQEKADPSTDDQGVRRGRGRQKLIEAEDETPAAPKRGRKRTNTGSELLPEDVPADGASKLNSPRSEERDELPKTSTPIAQSKLDMKETIESTRKKRGRFRKEGSPTDENEVESEKPAPVSTRKSPRSAEDSDSADTAPDDADKAKRRGRPPPTDDSRSTKQNQKSMPLRGKGKKTVLKVALPIRTRSTRGHAGISGQSPPAGESGSAAQFSLPPPPPPALSASRSPSPKIASPRGTVRSVRVPLKKKPQRNSHASDTDTAEETLDQEEFLRQKEKLESSPSATSTPSTSHRVVVCTLPVNAESAKALPSSSITTTTTMAAARLDEPAGKKQKTATDVGITRVPKDGADRVRPQANAAAVLIVEGKRERKRKVMSEFADPNAVLEPAPVTVTKSHSSLPSQQSIVRPSTIVKSVAVTSSVHSAPSAVTVKPMVTIVNPSMTNRPNITLVSSASQPSCSYLHTAQKPILITVPPNPSRPNTTTSFSGITKTIVVPKVITRPIVQNVHQQQNVQQRQQQSAQQMHPQLHQHAQIRSIRLSPSMTSTPVQRSATTIISRPPAQRVLPSPIRPNKVFLRTVAPIIPQRHITVQATPSQPTVRSITEPAGSRPVSAAMVIRNPPKAVVKPSEATAKKPQTTTVRRVTQQIVKPVERKTAAAAAAPPPPPPPAKKAAVQPRKVINVARVTPETVQPTSSMMDKLLEEPRLPKVGKKPLSKKQRSMRKTDLIKTSTRSRRRGTDLQINYNEDRLSKITDEDSDSQEEVPTSTDELGSPEDIQQSEQNDGQEPQDDIPVAVVEVFLSQDEVKLREVHSPTKQDLVDLNRQPVEQPMEVALGGQGAPEGFFTSEEGLVETVDVPFEGASIEAMKAGLVSTNDNAFAKSLMLGDDALLRRKISKRKSNPLAKE